MFIGYALHVLITYVSGLNPVTTYVSMLWVSSYLLLYYGLISWLILLVLIMLGFIYESPYNILLLLVIHSGFSVLILLVANW